MIDLSKPEHRDALRLACVYMQRYPSAPILFSLAFELSAEVCTVSVDVADAHASFAALSSPADSAAIVRALLERCGVKVVEQGVNRGNPDFPYVSVDDGSRYDNGDVAALYVSWAQDATARKLLRLLDLAPGDRDGALAALREAGR